MEGKKLEKKLRVWASDLSFTLPDGSAPPMNYFALLTATPHRRQLWEVLIESVQPRQKVEHMRKQIMVIKLKERKKGPRKGDSAPATDRIELWHKQTTLENRRNEKENEVIKLERIIIAKASDVLFEISKLAKLEKVYEEYGQKALILRLFTKRENDMRKNLEKILLKVAGRGSCSEHFEMCEPKGNMSPMKGELFNAEVCRGGSDEDHDSKLGNKLKELWKSGISNQNMWEEIVKWKEGLLHKFSMFLEELNSREKSVLSAKEGEVEESLSATIRRLKQKATEKSLRVILNSTERQALDWEIEKLGEALYEGEFRRSPDGTFGRPISPLATAGPSDSLSCYRKDGRGVEKYASVVGLKCYKEFLEEESKRLEEVARTVEKKGCKKAEEPEGTVKAAASFECIIEEISGRRSEEEEEEEEKVAKEILASHERVVRRLRTLREEAEDKRKERAIEDADKIKCAFGKLIGIFVETPLDAFRTVADYSGRLLFECESPSHCLSGYGGELSQFFSAILIPPQPDLRLILSEVEARRKMLQEVRNVIRRRDELAQLLKKTQHRMDSITLDSRFCEGNFQESDGVLRNVLLKGNELLRETDFIESILRNWVEQPYRWIVGQT